jgi:hypothetical protein
MSLYLIREAQMPTQEELRKAHDDGERGINRPIRDSFAEHFSTKHARELQSAWQKGAENTKKQQEK